MCSAPIDIFILLYLFHFIFYLLYFILSVTYEEGEWKVRLEGLKLSDEHCDRDGISYCIIMQGCLNG